MCPYKQCGPCQGNTHSALISPADTRHWAWQIKILHSQSFLFRGHTDEFKCGNCSDLWRRWGCEISAQSPSHSFQPMKYFIRRFLLLLAVWDPAPARPSVQPVAATSESKLNMYLYFHHSHSGIVGYTTHSRLGHSSCVPSIITTFPNMRTAGQNKLEIGDYQ